MSHRTILFVLLSISIRTAFFLNILSKFEIEESKIECLIIMNFELKMAKCHRIKRRMQYSNSTGVSRSTIDKSLKNPNSIMKKQSRKKKLTEIDKLF